MRTILILVNGAKIAAVASTARQRKQWAEHARAELRLAGHRSGGARTAVIDQMTGQDCCLTAQEIFDLLRADGRDAGIASVYRALELLTRMGLVRRVEVGEAAGYEPELPSGDHHHHVVCDRCGRVGSFEDEALERAIDRLARRLDFDVGRHDVVLRGACEDCRR